MRIHNLLAEPDVLNRVLCLLLLDHRIRRHALLHREPLHAVRLDETVMRRASRHNHVLRHTRTKLAHTLQHALALFQ